MVKRKYFSPRAKKEPVQNPNAIVVTASGVKINATQPEDETNVSNVAKSLQIKSNDPSSKIKSNDPLGLDDEVNDTKGSDPTNYDREGIIGEVNPYDFNSPVAATKTPSNSSLKFGRKIIRFDSLYLTSCSGVLLEVAISISIIICIITSIPKLCGDKNNQISKVSKSNNQYEGLFPHRLSPECYYGDIYFIYNIVSIGMQLLLLSFYAIHLIEYTSWIPWLSIEVIFYFILISGHLILASFCIAKSSGMIFAAGVFGILLAFLSMIQFGSRFHKCRKGTAAQPGEGDPDNEHLRLSEGRKRFRISTQSGNNHHYSPGRFWKL